jgi:periplasmic protein TonB
MTAQQFLNADYLDILFENRNKSYGAYLIRKQYPSNLLKALASVLLLVGCFAIFAFTKNKNNGGAVLPDSDDSVHVTIVDVVIKDPQQPKPQRIVPSQPPQRLDNVPVIVEDPDAAKQMPNRMDTVEYNPGSANKPGTGDDPNYVPGVIGDKPVVVQNPVTPSPPTIEEPEIRERVEIAPEFPGGYGAWISYLQKMLRIPDEMESGIRKTVKVKFVVNASGEITDAVVLQSAGPAFDREVLRVINRMPKWKPGRQNGKAVPVYFIQPVTFEAVND